MTSLNQSNASKKTTPDFINTKMYATENVGLLYLPFCVIFDPMIVLVFNLIMHRAL